MRHGRCDGRQRTAGDSNLSWYAVRNASDPQIANPSNNIKTAGDAATQIYAKCGGLTTAASVIAIRAIIHSATK